MQPQVQLTILDGALGILPLSFGDIVAVVGPTSSGPVATPAAFARTKDVISNFGSGPGVEAACLLIQLTGKPVVMVRTAASDPSSETAIDISGFTGTSTPTIDPSTDADDDYEVQIAFTTSGTIGTAGIKYRTSLDGGRTQSAVAALNTATNIVVPTPAGLVQVDFEAPTAPIVALANDLRTEFLAHIAYTTGTVHVHADATSGGGMPVASTNIATAIVLLNHLRTGYEAHRVLVGAGAAQVHIAADNVDTITAAVATDADSARTLANDLKTKFAAHEANTTAHTIADAVNVVTTAAAPAANTGTVNAGDVLSFRTTTAYWNTTDLNGGLTSLTNTKQTWNIALIVGPSNAAAVEAVDAWLISLEVKNKFKYAIMNTRIPDIGESEATYQTALGGIFGEVATVWVDLCAGACKLISAVTARNYRRPVAWIDAVRASGVDPAIDLADVTKGPLPSCAITDANGNPDDHDESLFPGLDDQRFTTLRTFDGLPGVWINNGRIFAPIGSDFIFVQFRRVMNVACTALVGYLVLRLSSEVFVNPKTGFITQAQQQSLNNGGTQAMAAVTLPQKRAAKVAYVVSATDQILSTFTITGEARVTPNGYVKFFSTTIGFNNPALRTSTTLS